MKIWKQATTMKSASHILLTLTLWHVACDGIVGSLKVPDNCGVCGGNNSSCRIISGIFTRPQLPSGYNLITQLPAGACNLSILELKHTKNYLSLRSSNGSFVINGNWTINQPGDYIFSETKFTYLRPDNSTAESIYSSGPLPEPFDLLVIYQEPNPGVKYQYQLPVLMPKLEVPRNPDSLHWITDNGINNNNINDQSYRSNHMNNSGNGIQAIHSNGQIQNDIQKRPRLRKRKVHWKVSGLSQCSKPCGGGTQAMIVICVRVYNQVRVSDKRCGTVEKPEQRTIQCNVKPCIAQWVTEDWSRCTTSCGEGVETRNIVCRQEISPTLTIIAADGACLTPRPTHIDRTRVCHGPPCTDSRSQGTWTQGIWSECSSHCGPGMKNRTVSCTSGNCHPSNRPNSMSPCNNGPCRGDFPSQDLSWYFTEWSNECSAGCGTGTQTRKVFCSTKECDFRNRPDVNRPCFSDKQCGGQWYTGPWSECSETCGVGKQNRVVVCLANLRPNEGSPQMVLTAHENCLIQEKPATHQQCRMNQCNHQWYTTEWSQCSKSCGGGIQRREVRCFYETHVESNLCQEVNMPSVQRQCNPQQCTHHNSPDCEDKYNYNCHKVVQARLCRYPLYRTSCCYSCRNRRSLLLT